MKRALIVFVLLSLVMVGCGSTSSPSQAQSGAESGNANGNQNFDKNQKQVYVNQFLDLHKKGNDIYFLKARYLSP